MKTKTTVEYLDEVKAKLGISSDYELAKRLQLSKQRISTYRSGGTFHNAMAARVAEILDLSLAKVIADMELERARIHDARSDGFASANQEFWERIARKVAGVVLPVALASAIAAPSPVDAAQNSIAAAHPNVCVLCKVALRRRLQAWTAALAGALTHTLELLTGASGPRLT